MRCRPFIRYRWYSYINCTSDDGNKSQIHHHYNHQHPTTTSAITHEIDDKGLMEGLRWRCLAEGHAHAIAQCLDAPPALPPIHYHYIRLSCNCTLFIERFNRCLQLFSDSFAAGFIENCMPCKRVFLSW